MKARSRKPLIVTCPNMEQEFSTQTLEVNLGDLDIVSDMDVLGDLDIVSDMEVLGDEQEVRVTRNRRKKFSSEASARLNQMYLSGITKPDKKLREELARDCDKTPRSIQIWFQNRRAKSKANPLKQRSSSPLPIGDNSSAEHLTDSVNSIKNQVKGVSKKAVPLSKLNCKTGSKIGCPLSAQIYCSPRPSPYAHPMTARVFPDDPAADSSFNFSMKSYSSPQLDTTPWLTSPQLSPPKLSPYQKYSPQSQNSASPLTSSPQSQNSVSPLKKYDSSPQSQNSVSPLKKYDFSPQSQNSVSPLTKYDSSPQMFSVAEKSYFPNPSQLDHYQFKVHPTNTFVNHQAHRQFSNIQTTQFSHDANAMLSSADSHFLPKLEQITLSDMFENHTQSAMPFVMSSDMFSFADVPTIDVRFIDAPGPLPNNHRFKKFASQTDMNEITGDPAKFIEWLSK